MYGWEGSRFPPPDADVVAAPDGDVVAELLPLLSPPQATATRAAASRPATYLTFMRSPLQRSRPMAHSKNSVPRTAVHSSIKALRLRRPAYRRFRLYKQ